jgi:hypothetical protein
MIDRGRPSKQALPENDEPIAELTGPGVTTRRSIFDYRQAQVRQENGEWVLAVGSVTLARFGRSEYYAKQALTTLMYYRLTEMQLVGNPSPVASYFLASGQAPRGLMSGLMSDHFQPERLTVRQLGEQWFIADGPHPVLETGKRAEDAYHLLRVIRHYKFDHLCRIGPNDKDCLMLLVRSY